MDDPLPAPDLDMKPKGIQLGNLVSDWAFIPLQVTSEAIHCQPLLASSPSQALPGIGKFCVQNKLQTPEGMCRRRPITLPQEPLQREPTRQPFLRTPVPINPLARDRIGFPLPDDIGAW